MRRRQEWVSNPPTYVPTEAKPINEAPIPKEVGRRRAVYVDQKEVARFWDQGGIIQDSAPALTEEVHELEEQKRKSGRPRKDKQAP